MQSPLTNRSARIVKEPVVTIVNAAVIGFVFFLLQNFPGVGTYLLAVILTLAFLYTGLMEFLSSPKITWRGVQKGCIAIAILFLLSAVWYSPGLMNLPPVKARAYLALLWSIRVVVSLIAARFVIVNYRSGKRKLNRTELAS